jgi:hypothetical protein
LSRHFPNATIEASAVPWGYISDARLSYLTSRIISTRPDLLLLDPSPVWVTFPMVGPAIRRRVLPAFRGVFDRLSQVSHSLEGEILQAGPPVLFHLYQRPLGFLARAVFGTAPLCDVPEALDFISRLLRAADMRETRMVMLGSHLSSVTHHLAPETLAVIRRCIPEASEDRLQQFEDGLAGLCDRYGCAFLDSWSMLYSMLRPENFLADGVHLDAQTTSLRAAGIARAIARLEGDPAASLADDSRDGVPARMAAVLFARSAR